MMLKLSLTIKEEDEATLLDVADRIIDRAKEITVVVGSSIEKEN